MFNRFLANKNGGVSMNSRRFYFGKYKGENVNFIILNHIGYILWLLENTQFKLNESEQELFDARAKAVVNSSISYVYNKLDLVKYIKDKDSPTPFVVTDDGNIGSLKKYSTHPLVSIYRQYLDKMDKPILSNKRNYNESLQTINRIAFEESEYLDDEFDDNIVTESAILY